MRPAMAPGLVPLLLCSWGRGGGGRGCWVVVSAVMGVGSEGGRVEAVAGDDDDDDEVLLLEDEEEVVDG